MKTSYELSDWLGYISHKEIDFLKKLVQSLPDNPEVINIGAGAGTSTLAILEARIDAKCTTIDIRWESPFGSLKSAIDLAKAAGFGDRHKDILRDSVEVAKDWSKQVDMVFVDGDHTISGATGDIKGWLSHIKPNGIIAIHDYDKIGSYFRNHPDLEPISTEDILKDPHWNKTIKPVQEVTTVTDKLLVGKYDIIGQVDTTIAFRISED